MKKVAKITGITIISFLAITAIAMKVKEITPIAMNMHAPVYEQDGIALKGYDVTSYFSGNAIRGRSEIAVEWSGVKWYFSNEENMQAFLASPETYAPRFGGYCTKAVSTGFTAPNNPEIFAVHNNQLYIFSNEEVKAEFLRNPSEMIELCESNWN